MGFWAQALRAPGGGSTGPGDPREAAQPHPDVLEAWAEAMGGVGGNDPDFGLPVPSLALVAVRELADEEVFLDYRLSPGLVSRPSWYYPVNPEAEERRWA